MDGQDFRRQHSDETMHQDTIDALARHAELLGHNIVDMAGMLDDIAAESTRQRDLLATAQARAGDISRSNDLVIVAVRDVTDGAKTALASVHNSVEQVRDASLRTRDVASWMQNLTARMTEIEGSLIAIRKSNVEISAIARQVNILAINAKIEATRAGEAGHGFAFLADAVKELSRKTTTTADLIEAGIQTLSDGMGNLRSEAQGISELATAVLKDAVHTDAMLGDIPVQMGGSVAAAQEISNCAEQVEAAGRAFGPVFQQITQGIADTGDRILEAKKRAHSLIDSSEAIVQGSVAIGANTEDQTYIRHVQDIAAQISAAFHDGLANFSISESQLFDRTYRPIPGSNPQQHMTQFTTFTDRVLPPIQEPALAISEQVVFCAAIDPNGYLPTHNRKFSQPQRGDPVWNTANCRNRRIFNDRVGLKAGRSTAPFLLQVYRRDMGGGQFVMMKDLSAPIVVRGRHWGGVRLAYRF